MATSIPSFPSTAWLCWSCHQTVESISPPHQPGRPCVLLWLRCCCMTSGLRLERHCTFHFFLLGAWSHVRRLQLDYWMMTDLWREKTYTEDNLDWSWQPGSRPQMCERGHGRFSAPAEPPHLNSSPQSHGQFNGFKALCSEVVCDAAIENWNRRHNPIHGGN